MQFTTTDSPDHPVDPNEHWQTAYVVVLLIPILFLITALWSNIGACLRRRQLRRQSEKDGQAQPTAAVATEAGSQAGRQDDIIISNDDDLEAQKRAAHAALCDRMWFPWRDAVAQTEDFLPHPERGEHGEAPQPLAVPARCAEADRRAQSGTARGEREIGRIRRERIRDLVRGDGGGSAMAAEMFLPRKNEWRS